MALRSVKSAVKTSGSAKRSSSKKNSSGGGLSSFNRMGWHIPASVKAQAAARYQPKGKKALTVPSSGGGKHVLIGGRPSTVNVGTSPSLGGLATATKAAAAKKAAQIQVKGPVKAPAQLGGNYKSQLAGIKPSVPVYAPRPATPQDSKAYVPPSSGTRSSGRTSGGSGSGGSGTSATPAVAKPAVTKPVVAAPKPATSTPVTRPGTTQAGTFTSRGNRTYGQFNRKRQSRGPRSGLSMTPAMLQRLAGQRITNPR